MYKAPSKTSSSKKSNALASETTALEVIIYSRLAIQLFFCKTNQLKVFTCAHQARLAELKESMAKEKEKRMLLRYTCVRDTTSTFHS